MGQIKSKKSSPDIDKNHDGLITRQEVHTYIEEKMEAWKHSYEEELSAKTEEIQSLRAEMTTQLNKKQQRLEEWKQAYEDLQEKYSQLVEELRSETHDGRDVSSAMSNISPEAVEAVVKELLADPHINLKKVPDWLEGPFYFNMIWITLMVLERVMKSFKVDALGHEFQFIMNPQKS